LRPLFGAFILSSAGSSSALRNRYVSISTAARPVAAEQQITRQQTEGKQK
jgi:hypothetical protein